MDKDAHRPELFRFGVFEVDLRAGELRKRGVRVRIQDQPFQILSMLLERRGEVVSREELQKRLWSADTFVDFDLGLNKAINKIRDVLGDSAESPRFVETLPRRGYRFLAEVVVVGAAPAAKAGTAAPIRRAPALAWGLSAAALVLVVLA
ncbi:MAG TPA: winged helix-turn-helix domain-containing protein, partial [Vicinamibacterales bacterium]